MIDINKLKAAAKAVGQVRWVKPTEPDVIGVNFDDAHTMHWDLEGTCAKCFHITDYLLQVSPNAILQMIEEYEYTLRFREQLESLNRFIKKLVDDAGYDPVTNRITLAPEDVVSLTNNSRIAGENTDGRPEFAVRILKEILTLHTGPDDTQCKCPMCRRINEEIGALLV